MDRDLFVLIPTIVSATKSTSGETRQAAFAQGSQTPSGYVDLKRQPTTATIGSVASSLWICRGLRNTADCRCGTATTVGSAA
jgi:hypothetical protein